MRAGLFLLLTVNIANGILEPLPINQSILHVADAFAMQKWIFYSKLGLGSARRRSLRSIKSVLMEYH